MSERDLESLIDTTDPAWPIIQQWIREAHHSVEVLQTSRQQGEAVLLQLQITTRSSMGAVALETGGILLDHGWLRFLGSGSERMKGNLLDWNGVSEDAPGRGLKDAWIVAHDVVGGFFALNGGAFPGKPGSVFYFSPGVLRWENLNISYPQLLYWAICGDLGLFYERLRWPGWELETAALHGDQGFSIVPFLWANPEVPLAERSKRSVPMTELWNLQLALAQQIANLPPGTEVKINLV